MTIHELKCWPDAFRDVRAGIKEFEIRRDDRDYAKGDIVVLREYQLGSIDEESGVEHKADYTGETEGPFKIGYITRSACLPDGFCAFSILRMAVESKTPVTPVERIADALDVLTHAIDVNRCTLMVDNMTDER